MALIYFQKNFGTGILGGQMDPFKPLLSLYLDFVFLCVDKMYHLDPPCPYLLAWASSTSSTIAHTQGSLPRGA